LNTALLAKSDLPQRLHGHVTRMLESTVPGAECGVIAAAARGINPELLQDLETRLSMEGENLIVAAAHEAEEGVLIVLLPGQSIAFTHFIALSAKHFLQEAGLLSGGMAVAGYTGSAPSEEALADFVALLDADAASEIAIYPGQPAVQESPTVVTIDPNADLLDFLNVRLGLQGYDVLSALDGKEGLRLVESVQPDLVITELALPALDGYQVIQRIRNSRNPACKVVVLTDMTVEQDICKCFELGAADVIRKPFSPKELEARLKRLFA
jgi:CheY-like chemotaxis protein